MKETFFYQRLMSIFGEIGLVWTQDKETDSPAVRRIFLPAGHAVMKARIGEAFPGAIGRSHDAVGRITDRIERYLQGDAVVFSLDDLDLVACGAFQQRVLRLEFQIPRGRVSTYGALADKLGHPRAARAVGTALARNPFPIVIPCHRAIRADGTLGGFGGGLKMKRTLLEMEGVGFDRKNRALEPHFWP
ncbi:MAG: methylated-DNA--[protein]-cysteine S-methyltransferase [Pseudomonadota bacterium]